MHKKEAEQEGVWMNWCKAILIGGLTGFGVALVLLLLASLCISNGMLAGGQEERVIVMTELISSLTGTLVARKISGIHGLVLGAGIGLVLYLTQLAAGAIFYDVLDLQYSGICMLCAALCGGVAAGFFGKGHTGKRKKRKLRSVH